MHFKTCV